MQRRLGLIAEPVVHQPLDLAFVTRGHQLSQVSPGSLPGGQHRPARQLEQSQRIAARLDDDPLEDALVQPRRQRGLQQQARIAMAQRLDLQLRESRDRVTGVARREYERDLLPEEAASPLYGYYGKTLGSVRGRDADVSPAGAG